MENKYGKYRHFLNLPGNKSQFWMAQRKDEVLRIYRLLEPIADL